MGHISLFKRMKIISLFKQIELGCKVNISTKLFPKNELAKNNFGIFISSKSVKKLADKLIKENL